jgi:diaminopimelate decarboxylase
METNLSDINQDNRILPFTQELINKVVQMYETPLQLYDYAGIKQTASNFMETFKNSIPNFHQFYAVKALPNPYILQILLEQGMGLDCSSNSELQIAKMLNVPGEKIMFTSNYTSDEDLKLAIDIGAIINLDDITLISKLFKIANPMVKTLFFRYNPGIGKTNSETKSNILGGPDAKFGMEGETIIQSIQIAQSLGVKEFGIHMMTGSNVLDIEYWDELVDKIFDLVGSIYQTTGIKISGINLGGGIGINYRTGILPEINLLAKKIGKNIEKNLLVYGLDKIQVYMENGRFITGPHGYLVSKCNVVKNLYGQTFYGLDACMSNLMRPGMYGAYHRIDVLGKSNMPNENLKEANVVGTLCENNDWFAKNRLLPQANPSDLFVIWDTGAHSHSMGFQYNGKLRAPEILINEGDFKQIRERETFSHYMSTVPIRSDWSFYPVPRGQMVNNFN